MPGVYSKSWRMPPGNDRRRFALRPLQRLYQTRNTQVKKTIERLEETSKAIAWLEEEIQHKWKSWGFKETMEWYGTKIVYVSCWSGNISENEYGERMYRNPGTIMKLKDDSEGYDLYSLEVVFEFHDGSRITVHPFAIFILRD